MVAAWEDWSLRARFTRKHFEITVELIIEAVATGDLQAADSLTRVFLSWPNRSDYRLGESYSVRMRVPCFVTATALDLPWDIARVELTDPNARGIKPETQAVALCGELLLRYWADLRHVLILLMLNWTVRGSADELAMKIAAALLQGTEDRVAYGRFDQYRLVDTLRILPVPMQDETNDSDALALGIEEGGIQSAEALLLARYFMYSQVYFHPVRRIYDIHLKDFMVAWLEPDGYPFSEEDHLRLTDTEVMAAMRIAEQDAEARGHNAARHILGRKHFKTVYSRNPGDLTINPEAGTVVLAALEAEFGTNRFRHDRYAQKAGVPDFPVTMRDGRIASSLSVSVVFMRLPLLSVDTVFAERGIHAQAETWLNNNRDTILQPVSEE